MNQSLSFLEAVGQRWRNSSNPKMPQFAQLTMAAKPFPHYATFLEMG